MEYVFYLDVMKIIFKCLTNGLIILYKNFTTFHTCKITHITNEYN